MKILNLTQHIATPDQISAGVVEPSPADKALIQSALTFDTLPDSMILRTRAETLAMYVSGTGHKSAMIGGAPYFMAPLEKALINSCVRPLYAFSVRETDEQTQPDGSVKTVAAFRHAGFIGTEYAEV